MEAAKPFPTWESSKQSLIHRAEGGPAEIPPTGRSADAQHLNFVEFAGNGQVSGVLYATGFTIEVLEHVWEKYSPALISAAATDPAFDAGFKTLRGSPPELEYEVALSFYAGLRYIAVRHEA